MRASIARGLVGFLAILAESLQHEPQLVRGNVVEFRETVQLRTVSRSCDRGQRVKFLDERGK